MSDNIDGPRVYGTNTARYSVIQESFYLLVIAFEQVLQPLSEKLFSNKLISGGDVDNVINPNQPVHDRAVALLRTVMKWVEYDQMNFETVVSVLSEFRELSEIVDDLLTALKEKEDACVSTAASGSSPQHTTVRGLSEDSGIASGVVAGDFISSKGTRMEVKSPDLELHTEECSECSSGIPEVSTHSGPKVVVVSQPSASLPNAQASAPTDSLPEQETTVVPSGDHSASTLYSLHTKSCDDGEGWNYLKGQAAQHQGTSINKLKRQGSVIKKTDEQIDILSKESVEKGKRVVALKAEMERAVNDFQVKYSDTEEQAESFPKMYQDQVTRLQEEVKAVESRERREREAQSELDATRDQLANLQLEKERELSNMRIQMYELHLRQEKRKKIEAEKKAKQAQDEADSAKEEAKSTKEKYKNLKVEMDGLKKKQEEDVAETRKELNKREKMLMDDRETANVARRLALEERATWNKEKEKLNQELVELKEKHRQEIESYEERLKQATIERKESDNELTRQPEEP